VTYLEATQQTLVHAHHGARIVELATVVWRREECNELPLREELIAVLCNLVGAAYKVHVVFLQEATDDIWPKGKGHAAVVFAPAGDVLVGVGPEKIAEEAAVGDL
jgi:hypothetical protein